MNQIHRCAWQPRTMLFLVKCVHQRRFQRRWSTARIYSTLFQHPKHSDKSRKTADSRTPTSTSYNCWFYLHINLNSYFVLFWTVQLPTDKLHILRKTCFIRCTSLAPSLTRSLARPPACSLAHSLTHFQLHNCEMGLRGHFSLSVTIKERISYGTLYERLTTWLWSASVFFFFFGLGWTAQRFQLWVISFPMINFTSDW